MGHHLEDDGYRFELGTAQQFDTNLIEIRDHRLMIARKGVVVADLAKKRFIVPPSDAKRTYNHDGLVLREGTDNLLKIVAHQGKSPTLFRFDMRSGRHTESAFPGYRGQIKKNKKKQSQPVDLLHFDDVVLLNDGSSLTAWIVRGDE